MNGENNPCDNVASITSGRFIHLEQEKVKFREDETGWAKIANTLANIFPKDYYRNPISSNTYQECDILFSFGVIPAGNSVTFIAGNRIVLEPGFQAHEGAVFSARIEAFDPVNFRMSEISNHQQPNEVASIPEQLTRVEKVRMPFKVDVYPNPVRGDILNLKFHGLEAQDIAIITLYDPYGRTLRQQQIQLLNGSHYQMKLSEIPAGLYFLHIQVDDKVLTQQVVLQR